MGMLPLRHLLPLLAFQQRLELPGLQRRLEAKRTDEKGPAARSTANDLYPQELRRTVGYRR